MKPTDFANALTDFLGRYLTVECGYSPNTVTTYSYTFSLFTRVYEDCGACQAGETYP